MPLKRFSLSCPPPPPIYNLLPTVLFCNQNLGNQNVSWTFGGRGCCPGRFFLTNKHRLLTAHKACNNPYITSSLSSCHPTLRLRSHDAVMIWKRNRIITERPPVHTMPEWKPSEDGTKWKRNSYRCEMKTELHPASCEHSSIRNRIMTVPGQWCRFQVILASCERALKVGQGNRLTAEELSRKTFNLKL